MSSSNTMLCSTVFKSFARARASSSADNAARREAPYVFAPLLILWSNLVVSLISRSFKVVCNFAHSDCDSFRNTSMRVLRISLPTSASNCLSACKSLTL